MKKAMTYGWTIALAVLMVSGAEGALRGRRGTGGRPGVSEPPPGAAARHGGMLQRLLQNTERAADFGIDGEQLEACRDRYYEFERERIGLQARLRTTALELKRQLQADEADREAVMAASGKVQAARAAMAEAVLAHRLDLREILGKETIEEIRSAARQRMRRRPARGAGPPRPDGWRRSAWRDERLPAPPDA